MKAIVERWRYECIPNSGTDPFTVYDEAQVPANPSIAPWIPLSDEIKGLASPQHELPLQFLPEATVHDADAIVLPYRKPLPQSSVASSQELADEIAHHNSGPTSLLSGAPPMMLENKQTCNRRVHCSSRVRRHGEKVSDQHRIGYPDCSANSDRKELRRRLLAVLRPSNLRRSTGSALTCDGTHGVSLHSCLR